jgi:hypothetical protein
MADEERFCAWRRCGKVLVQGEHERLSMFRARITCGHVCGGKLTAAARVKHGTIRACPKPYEANLKPEVRLQVDELAAEMLRKRMMRGALR